MPPGEPAAGQVFSHFTPECAPEDLPRIFEKGYTGYNGRSDQKASGLGLYLCRTICRRLGHAITASSVPDHGTAIRIALDQRRVRE